MSEIFEERISKYSEVRKDKEIYWKNMGLCQKEKKYVHVRTLHRML